MQSERSQKARHLEGIEVRHSSGCPTRRDATRKCGCNPSYRGTAFDPHMLWTDANDRPRTGKAVRGPWTKVLSEARSWRMNVLQKIEQGTLIPPNSVTIREAAEEFIADMKSGRAKSKFRAHFKPKTVRQYEWSLRAHVLPHLGDRRLSSLRRRDLLDWVERLEFEHEPSTIHNAASPLSCIFKRALDRELIDANPMAGLPLPPEQASPVPPASIVGFEEAQARLAVLDPLDASIWACAFFAGLRMGELRALRRQDVIGLARLCVRGGWDDREGRQDPKTRAGAREVPLITALRNPLAVHLERSDLASGDLVFSGLRGATSFDPSALRRRTYEQWRAHGFEPIKPHHARHTFASWLIAAGIPLPEVARYMGHSSSRVTERTYFHLLPDNITRNAQRIEAFLGGGER